MKRNFRTAIRAESARKNGDIPRHFTLLFRNFLHLFWGWIAINPIECQGKQIKRRPTTELPRERFLAEGPERLTDADLLAKQGCLWGYYDIAAGDVVMERSRCKRKNRNRPIHAGARYS